MVAKGARPAKGVIKNAFVSQWYVDLLAAGAAGVA
jgi:hypothetical protein